VEMSELGSEGPAFDPKQLLRCFGRHFVLGWVQSPSCLLARASRNGTLGEKLNLPSATPPARRPSLSVASLLLHIFFLAHARIIRSGSYKTVNLGGKRYS